MRLKINRAVQQAPDRAFVQQVNFLDNRIGFWGDVTAVNSQMNAVDVIADIGITFRNIPVMSREWVNASDGKDYVTAERDLPPIGSRVFVLTPTHTITGAFVLCSGYSKGDTDTHTLFAASDDKQEEKNAERERVTQGGWNETEDYNNGNRNFVSADGNISIAVNTAENSDKEQKKEVSLIAWKNEIHVTEEGVEITIPKNANLTLNVEGDDSISIKGNHSLSVEGDCSVSSKGNISVKADGDCNVEGKNITAKGNVKVTGGTFEAGGTVVPTGSGALCGIPICPFTGAPHVGNRASGT